MGMLIRLLISCLLLFPYSFGLVWLFSINESGSSEALQGMHRYAFFLTATIALVCLWTFTWFTKLRRHSCIGLFFALLGGLAFSYLGYPKSLGMLALSAPLIIASVVCIGYQKSKQNI